MGRTRRWAGLLLAAAALAGCSADGLAFREDTRVEITAPADRDEVQAPVRLTWSTADLPAGTRFGVFVDRTPPPPGEDLSWVARGDDSCGATPGCPDEAYLAERHVHVTDGNSVVLTELPPSPSDRRYREFHEATVVLLDEDGRRRGEAAWAVEFRVADGS